MNADYFRTLYDWRYWARDRVLTAAGDLTEEDYARPNGFTYGNVRGILTHTLGSEILWCARVLGEMPRGLLTQEELPTVTALRALWEEEERKMRAFLAQLTDQDVEKSVSFRGRDGNERVYPVWQLLTLVFHHTVQHRSEAAEALTAIGRSPGDMDFLVYLNRAASR